MGSNCSSSGEKQFSLAPFSRSMKYSGRREMNLNTYQYKTPWRCNILRLQVLMLRGGIYLERINHLELRISVPSF